MTGRGAGAPTSALEASGTAIEISRALRRRRRLRAGILQLLYLLAAVALGFLAPKIDVGFVLPSNRAIELLLAVGAGTVTFIGLVFSLLFLVVQFGSTSYTPRLTLFRDSPVVWHAFAFFTAVIVYSFAAVLAIGRAEEASGLVPILAALGVLGTVALYRMLQMRAFGSIQLGPILAEVERRGRRAIDELYVEDFDPAELPLAEDAGLPADEFREVLWSRPAGVLQIVDVPALLRLIERTGARIEMRVGAGAALFEDAPIARVAGGGEEVDEAIRGALAVGVERTVEQDPAFALRILADISLRGLSPAVNDPSTAVQALDATESLMRRLARRRLDIGRLRAPDGTVRLILVLRDWEEYVAVACDEVIAFCGSSPTVTARVRRLLGSLAAAVPAARREPLERRLDALPPLRP
ncbi:MAG: DUF2254 domain-containing protein [Actinobacteria bacterium]|nr:DUF2254 domain-containing protein [Actinomycetota bacterium]